MNCWKARSKWYWKARSGGLDRKEEKPMQGWITRLATPVVLNSVLFLFVPKSLMVDVSELTNWVAKWWAHPLASVPHWSRETILILLWLLNVHRFLRTSHTGTSKPKPNKKQKTQAEVERCLTQAWVKCCQVAPTGSWVKLAIDQATTAVLE